MSEFTELSRHLFRAGPSPSPTPRSLLYPANQDAAFLSAVAPAVALVSVGVGNPYGHPAPSTLHAMAAAGVVVGRTDEEGDLAVVAYAGRAMLVPRRPP